LAIAYLYELLCGMEYVNLSRIKSSEIQLPVFMMTKTCMDMSLSLVSTSRRVFRSVVVELDILDSTYEHICYLRSSSILLLLPMLEYILSKNFQFAKRA
jgi:hypothetical protein